MAISNRDLELALKVQACESQITTLEKSIDNLNKELKEYLKEARGASFKKWELLTLAVITIIASILGAAIQKILPG